MGIRPAGPAGNSPIHDGLSFLKFLRPVRLEIRMWSAKAALLHSTSGFLTAQVEFLRPTAPPSRGPRSGPMTLAVGFSPRGQRKTNDPSRQRRLSRGGATDSIVADATGRPRGRAIRGLKPTAKVLRPLRGGGGGAPVRRFGALVFPVILHRLRVNSCYTLNGHKVTEPGAVATGSARCESAYPVATAPGL